MRKAKTNYFSSQTTTPGDDPETPDPEQGTDVADADDAQDDDEDESQDTPDGDTDDEPVEGEDALGDPGKKALDRMKSERNEARRARLEAERRAKELEDQLAARDRSPEENELERVRAEARSEAEAKANARLIKSEVRAAAAGKLKNPADALAFLDVQNFHVDENGDVDTSEIEDALAGLLEARPYLAAQSGGQSFDTSRGKRAPSKKLTPADLKSMTPEQIAKAYDEGRIQQ